MTAPTQAYPPWLSPQPITVTQDGVAVVQTTVVQFPQTYYGPSIPLGPDWVFGGSTFPASIATSFSTPSASTPSTSAIPTTSAAPTSSQSQSTASSSSQSQSTTSALSTTPSTSSPSPSSSAPASSTSGSPSVGSRSSGLSSGTRLAIILSTILGTLMLAALLFVLFRIRRRVKRRRDLAAGRGEGFSWSFINGSSTQHHAVPGAEEAEGADGEDAAFLAREPDVQENMPGPAFFPAWPKPPPQHPVVPETTVLTAAAASRQGSTGTKSDSSTLDSDAKREDIARFNASSSTADAGSLFFNPGRGGEGGTQRRSDEAAADDMTLAAGVAAAFGSQPPNYAARPPGAAPPRVPARSPSRPIAMPTPIHFQPPSPRAARDDEGVYDNDVQRMNALRARESLEEEDAEAQLIPPRRIDPDRTPTSQPSSAGSRGSWAYPESPPSETDERATLLTARRVNLGQTAHPVLASPTSDKKSLEGWVTPPNEDEEQPDLSPRSWSVTMGGLAGFAKGLGRLSWFRRMDNEAGPSGTRHSSPSRSRGSRPPSMVGIVRPGSASRPHSGLLRPAPGSRPQSGVSFRSIDAELGLRPPGVRASAAGSGNGSGSGSGKSGATVYHSVSSRPRTPHYASNTERMSHQVQFAHAEPPMLRLPPDLDLGEGGSTVRSVDVLDLPVPERSLPLSSSILPDTSLRSAQQDTVSSKDTTSGAALAFPPGLVSVPKWDRGSQSGSSNHEGRDVLEDEPPQAGGEWSSLRSKTSAGDVNEETNTTGRRRGGPVTRSSTGEQAVQVIMGEHAPSETASIATGPRQPSDSNVPLASVSPRSPRSLAGFGLSLTPRVSMYETSRSDVASHSGDGSYSSQPSHTASHSQGLSQPSSNPESEDGHHPPSQGAGFNRASLGAIGGEQGPPQLPPLRPLSNMQPTVLERTAEDRETEGSDTSRPGTGTSRPMSEGTHTGTFASGTGSTGVQTTVASSSSPGRK